MRNFADIVEFAEDSVDYVIVHNPAKNRGDLYRGSALERTMIELGAKSITMPRLMPDTILAMERAESIAGRGITFAEFAQPGSKYIDPILMGDMQWALNDIFAQYESIADLLLPTELTERDKQQTTWLSQREHEIVEKGKQNLAKTKWYCAGVTILAIAFSGLFCLSQIHEKRLIALQANAEIQTKVEEQIRRVEPTAYRMALEIVKNSRQVRLADGIDAWEVDLPVSAGIVCSSVRRDEQNAVKAICLFMRDNPERVTLEALAANAKKEKGQNAPK